MVGCMSKLAIDALLSERNIVLDLMASLNPDEWAMPSDCAGWRVQDVLCHMASVYHSVADPSTMPAVPDTGGDAERSAEAVVQARRDWTAKQVIDEYDEWSTKAIAGLNAMQDEPMASTVVPLGNLGSHPLHLLANALVFDHYCHLRHDLLQPDGGLFRPPLDSSDLQLAPTMAWMLGGLPQMCADALRIVDRPVVLQFDGAGGGSWTLQPVGPEGLTAVSEGGAPDAAATARSTAHAFVQWGTKRRDWRDRGVIVSGDTEYGARVLDAINVI